MKSFGMAPLAGMLFALGSMFLWAGCSGQKDPAPLGGNSSSASAGGPQISAAPNPVPAGSGKGKTTITWHAGSGNTGEVYLVTLDGGEKRFGGHAPKGRQEASFITANRVFEFRLYEGKEHKKLLASVKVTREKNNQ